MPPEQIRQFTHDSVQAELAGDTFERDWSSLEVRFPPTKKARAGNPYRSDSPTNPYGSGWRIEGR